MGKAGRRTAGADASAVPEHQEFGVLGRLTPGQYHQTASGRRCRRARWSLAREPAAQGHPEPVDMHADDGTFDCAARNSCSALGAYMAANAPPAVVTLRG